MPPAACLIEGKSLLLNHLRPRTVLSRAFFGPESTIPGVIGITKIIIHL